MTEPRIETLELDMDKVNDLRAAILTHLSSDATVNLTEAASLTMAVAASLAVADGRDPCRYGEACHVLAHIFNNMHGVFSQVDGAFSKTQKH